MLAFTDAKTWYPGIEYRPDLDPEDPLFFRDKDASTVVPSRDNEIYSTRVVDTNGRLMRDLFGWRWRRARARHRQPGRRPSRAIDGTDPGTTPTCRWACG